MVKNDFAIKITEVEKECGITMPTVYTDYLSKSAELVFDNVLLYDLERIQERYFALEFNEDAPNFIPIGNDNGDYELIMESGKDKKEVGIIERGAIGTALPVWLNDFKIWIETGHSFKGYSENKANSDWSAYVKVILKKAPANRSEVLMLIRKAFSLDIPITELMNASKNIPYLITDKYTAAQAKRILEKYKIGEWVEWTF